MLADINFIYQVNYSFHALFSCYVNETVVIASTDFLSKEMDMERHEQKMPQNPTYQSN